ncbi:hypothetical protein KFL_006340050 [Klebsormidium nitens]|uniref:Uncharacterized protein n=1 Tax=Klebsormidium nitens TaxID=105231 RepID=A0A1Y1IHN0_KLENI|nr:hypothetical protein KFL_006340050 [Klebsormidium nitens]|eukprot:GAQ90385.1 hypothetical protein KFL_006340050 [Klebsormidium nitens]
MSLFNQLLNEFDDDPGINAPGTSSGATSGTLTLPTKRWLGDVDVSDPSPNPLLENNTAGRVVGDYFGVARGGLLSYPGFAPQSDSSLAHAGDTYVFLGPGLGDNSSSWAKIKILLGTNAVGSANIAPGAVTSEKLAPQTTIVVQNNGETVDLSSDDVNAVMFGPKADGSWRILATKGALLFQSYTYSWLAYTSEGLPEECKIDVTDIQTVAEGFICLKLEREIVLAFRGTADFSDVCEDLDLLREHPASEMDPGVFVHRGFCQRCKRARPTFGFEGNKPSHCLKYEKVSRNYKIKEQHFVDHIKAAGVLPDTAQVTFDKKLQGGCSARRPDIFVDVYTHTVHSECDEEQHSSSNYSCDNKRLMELFQDAGNRPQVQLRFNPDSFTSADGLKHPSCFKYNKLGVPVIRDQAMWEARMKVYLERLNYHLTHVPEREVTVEHLFYDGYSWEDQGQTKGARQRKAKRKRETE